MAVEACITAIQFIFIALKQLIVNSLPPMNDVVALSRQSRGMHSVIDVSNRHKYHEFKLGREGRNFTDQLQAGQDMLLKILATPSFAGYRRLELFRGETDSGVASFESEVTQRVLSPEDINRLKQALTKAGLKKHQDRESILSILRQDPVFFRCNSLCAY
jgi:uncharacterized Zn finger protein